VNEYEILLLLDPDLAEERAEEIVARVRERVEGDGGSWDGHEPWGRRKLAYEIDHKSEGVYHLLTFRSTPETLDEVSRVLKITDGVMRHMATRRPKPHRRADATAATAPPPAEAVVAAAAEAADGEGGEE
jgi:small subunit ribosomal protein S6